MRANFSAERNKHAAPWLHPSPRAFFHFKIKSETRTKSTKSSLPLSIFFFRENFAKIKIFIKLRIFEFAKFPC